MSDDAPAPPPNPNDPKRTGVRWLDMIVACSALLISAVSIFVAYQSNQSMERLTRASAWPFLQLTSSNAGDGGARVLGLGVENVGTGPARVYRYTVEVDDQAVPMDAHLLTEILRACCNAEFEASIAAAGGVLPVYGAEMSSPVSRRFLAPEGGVIAMQWPRTEQNATAWDALDRARQEKRIVASVCYCSVFDECWIARSDTFPPQETDSCERADLQEGR